MLRDKALHPLSHQHHNGLALVVMTYRALGEDPSSENLRRQAEKVVGRFDLELVNHFQLEEELLMPPLAARLPIVAELLDEHRRMEALAERLRTAPDEALLRVFLDLLRSHIRREENVLFEEAQKILTREELDAMGAQFEARAVRTCL